MPALVVAMAGKPTCSRILADPASQALGSTKPEPVCRARRAAALSAGAPVVTSPPRRPRRTTHHRRAGRPRVSGRRRPRPGSAALRVRHPWLPRRTTPSPRPALRWHHPIIGDRGLSRHPTDRHAAEPAFYRSECRSARGSPTSATRRDGCDFVGLGCGRLERSVTQPGLGLPPVDGGFDGVHHRQRSRDGGGPSDGGHQTR